MPYNKSTEQRDGKTVFCITSIKTGKKLCYESEDAREKGIRIREAASHLKGKAYKKYFG